VAGLARSEAGCDFIDIKADFIGGVAGGYRNRQQRMQAAGTIEQRFTGMDADITAHQRTQLVKAAEVWSGS
jgi:hypothetical protein